MEPLAKLAPKDRQERVEDAWRDLILALGYDIQSPHLTASPRRVARFLVGWHTNLNDAPPTMTTFPNEEHYDQMVAVGRISFFSMCPHHGLPFYGTAAVGYLPGDRIVGLSKLAREQNVQRCLNFVMAHPEWRIGIQLHKLIGQR